MEDQRNEAVLTPAKDAMAVVLTDPGGFLDPDALADEALDRLKAMNVALLPDRNALLEWLRDALAASGKLKGAIVAKGEPPTPGEDGRIEWARNFFDTDFAVDPATGAVNYRERQGDPAVEAGEFLARVIPPVEGKAGRDVFGKPITPPKSKGIRITSGPRVRHAPDENSYYAEESGRVRFVGNKLSVDQVFTVPGSVGLESGHVRHPGAIVVAEDVLQGSRVSAEGDVEVRGMVEPSDIITGGRLTVRGGITGGPSVAIKATGGVKARYILEAVIEAGEDVEAETEILHSTIRTRGRLAAPGARLVGGSVSALGGIEVQQAGSPSSVPTKLTAAEDPQLEQAVKLQEERMASYAEQIRRIEQAIAPIESQGSNVPLEKQRALDGLRAKLTEFKEGEAEARKEIAAIREESDKRTRKHIHIGKVVYPDTILRIGGVSHRVIDLVKGPVKAILHDGQIELVPALRQR